MKKIEYFLAGVYQALKNKRPEGTPYFNLRLLIVATLFIHYVELAIVVRRHSMINLIPFSKTKFLICLISISTFLM